MDKLIVLDLTGNSTFDDIPGDTKVHQKPRGFDVQVGGIDVEAGSGAWTLAEWAAKYGHEEMMLESKTPSEGPGKVVAWRSTVLSTQGWPEANDLKAQARKRHIPYRIERRNHPENGQSIETVIWADDSAGQAQGGGTAVWGAWNEAKQVLEECEGDYDSNVTFTLDGVMHYEEV